MHGRHQRLPDYNLYGSHGSDRLCSRNPHVHRLSQYDAREQHDLLGLDRDSGGETLLLDSTTSDGEDTGGAAGWSLANSYDFKSSSNVWGTISNGQSFRVTIKGTIVSGTNNPPTVANTIPDQTATAGTAFSYAFPDTTFSDADSDTLTYAATKADDTALPTWLSFTDSTRTFSGTPQAADVETVSVKVTASDGNGGSVSDEFDITVSAAADTSPPTLTSATVLATGTRINLVFSENIALPSDPVDQDTFLTALSGAFSATAAGETLSISTLVTGSDSNQLFLVISTAIGQGQTVVITYTDPTSGDDDVALEDAAGNETATFTTGMNSVPAVTNNSAVNTPATGAPTITGTPQVGQTMTAVTTAIMDANGLTTVSYTYQWIRVDGGTETNISLATASTYTLVADDQAKTIKVKVSFTDDASNAETLTSVATAAVSAAANTAPTVATAIPGPVGDGGHGVQLCVSGHHVQRRGQRHAELHGDESRRHGAAHMAVLHRQHAHLLGYAAGRGRGDGLGEGDGERRQWRVGQRRIRYHGERGGGHHSAHADQRRCHSRRNPHRARVLREPADGQRDL